MYAYICHSLNTQLFVPWQICLKRSLIKSVRVNINQLSCSTGLGRSSFCNIAVVGLGCMLDKTIVFLQRTKGFASILVKYLEIKMCPYVTALLNIIHCFLNVFAFAVKREEFHIHVYCPGVGADQPLWSVFFFFFSELPTFSPFAHFLQVLPFK